MSQSSDTGARAKAQDRRVWILIFTAKQKMMLKQRLSYIQMTLFSKLPLSMASTGFSPASRR